MTNPILNKKIKDLTWEDKRELVAAKYIYWIITDSYSGNYSFLYDLITGSDMFQLTEENKEVSESEFNEMFGDYISDFKELTVEKMLEVCGTANEILPYL